MRSHYLYEVGTQEDQCETAHTSPGDVGRLREALASLTASGERGVIHPAIDEVKNRRDETTKILSAVRVVKLSIGLLAALLILASILLISNTIRRSLIRPAAARSR